MPDSAYCFQQADGWYTVVLEVECPDGSRFVRAWNNLSKEVCAFRLLNLQRMGEYRTERFDTPPMEVRRHA